MAIKGICNISKPAVWFWICELESIGSIQQAMEDSGFARIWTGVTVTKDHPVVTNKKIPQPAAMGIVCGTYPPCPQIEQLKLQPDQRNNVFTAPYIAPPLSTDTHKPVCKSAVSWELMLNLLSMVVKPGSKILEVFARNGPAMEYAVLSETCSCVSVDVSPVVARYLIQKIKSTLQALNAPSNRREEDNTSGNLHTSADEHNSMLVGKCIVIILAFLSLFYVKKFVLRCLSENNQET